MSNPFLTATTTSNPFITPTASPRLTPDGVQLGGPSVLENIKRLPEDLAGVAKAVIQPFPRALTSVMLSASKQMGGPDSFDPAAVPDTFTSADTAQPRIATSLFKTFLGTEPIRAVQDRITQAETAIKNSPFAQKTGLDHAAPLLAFGGVIGSTALDLTPFGGLEKNAAKTLLTETTTEGALKILQAMKVPEDIAAKFAPHFAEASTPAAVQDTLDIMKGSIGVKMKVGALNEAKGVVEGDARATLLNAEDKAGVPHTAPPTAPASLDENTYYHGTTDVAARSITKDGFKPGADDTLFGPKPTGLSLTTDRATAEEFANHRAQQTGTRPHVMEVDISGVKNPDVTKYGLGDEVYIPTGEVGNVKVKSSTFTPQEHAAATKSRPFVDITTDLENARSNLSFIKDAMIDHPGAGTGNLTNWRNGEFVKGADKKLIDRIGYDESNGGDLDTLLEHRASYERLAEQADQVKAQIKQLVAEKNAVKAEKAVKPAAPLEGQTFYRGDNVSAPRMNKAGEMSFSRDRSVAEQFAKGHGENGVVIEQSIAPGAKVLDVSKIDAATKADIIDGYGGFSESDITDYAHDEHYDVVDFSNGSGKGTSSAREIKVLNHDVLQPASSHPKQTPVQYHGTPEEFVGDLRPSAKGTYGPGFYLTQTEPMAKSFARQVKVMDGSGARVGAAPDLHVKPFDTTDLKLKVLPDNQSVLDEVAKITPETDSAKAMEEYRAALAKDGYDGIEVAKGGETVIFPDSLSKLKHVEASASELPKGIPPTAKSIGEVASTAARADQALAKLPATLRKDIPSLETIITRSPKDVRGKVNVLDYMRTPDRVLAKIGFENEAKMLRDGYEAYIKELPKNIEHISEWAKQVPKEADQKIFQFLDGKEVALTETERTVALEVKAWLKDWADRLGLPEDSRISSYITHIFDKELLAKEFDEDLAKIITDKIPGSVYDPFLESRLGARGYKQSTWEALDAYVKRATRKVNMDDALEAIQRKAGTSLELSNIEVSQFKYLQRYVSQVNMRPTELDNLLDNSIKSLVGYKYGQRPVTYLTKLLRQMTYRGMLGLNPGSALRNLSQGINTYAVLGERYTATGYLKLFSKGAMKEIKEQGIMAPGFIQDRTLSSTKKAMERIDNGLFAFFDGAEKINRGAAYFGAKSKALKAGKSEEEAIDYAKSIVRKTQFSFGSIDTPVALQSDIVKTLAQFQNYTIKQTEFLAEMAKDKNFAGLLRYGVAGLAFVYTIGKAFGMDPSELIPAFRFATPPSLKLPTEVTKAALDTPDKFGNQRSNAQKESDVGASAVGLIPAGTQIKKTVQGISAYNKGKDTTPTGKTRFTIPHTPGNFVKTALFGKSSLPQAKKYYKGLGKKKATTSSNPFLQ